jgi:zinc protease
VGSTRDEPNRSGFAHFFEHMMFEGSGHMAPGEFQKTVAEVGGTCNANTFFDRTVYHETFPSNCLEKVLWMEADRMGFFYNTISGSKFEIQRATVKNERGQNVDNWSYGLMVEKVHEALYPFGHPYNTTAIGTIQDINQAKLEDVKRFFLRWYVPNNAVLVVCGDIKPEDVIKLTEKYFGSFQSGPKIEKLISPAVKLEKNRYISYKDNIVNPIMRMVYPTVPSFHQDEAALDILGQLLNGSKDMLWSKFCCEHPYASSAYASSPCYESAGQFQITIKLNEDEDLWETEEKIKDVLSYFEDSNISDEDLQIAKSKYKFQKLVKFEPLSDKAFALGQYELYYGNPNLFQTDIERYDKITAEDLKQVYRKYIKNKSAVILSVYPLENSKKTVVKKDNYLPVKNNLTVKEDSFKVSYKKPVDNFDRAIKPIPGPTPYLTTPEIWQEYFPNGLKLSGIYEDDAPYIHLRITLDAGHSSAQYDEAGVTAVLCNLLSYDRTKQNDARYYSTELKKMGSVIEFTSGSDNIVITLISMKENLEKTLLLLKEKMFSPAFLQYEFDWRRKQMMERVVSEKKIAPRIADRFFKSLLYGKKSIFAAPIIGNETTLTNLTFGDVHHYYYKNWYPENATVTIIGNIKKEEILSSVEFLKTWKAGKIKMDIKPEILNIDSTRIYFINKENAPHSEIRVGLASLPFDPYGENFKCQIMNSPLGSEFSSRINQKIREEDGYTYGGFSSFQSFKYTGQFVIKTSVNAVKTDSALINIMTLIKNYSDKGIMQNELENEKKTYLLNQLLASQSQEEKANYLWRLMYYNLDKNFMERQQEIINSITKEEIDALAKKHLRYSNMVIVVVGPKSILSQVKKIGYPVVELQDN